MVYRVRTFSVSGVPLEKAAGVRRRADPRFACVHSASEERGPGLLRSGLGERRDCSGRRLLLRCRFRRARCRTRGRVGSRELDARRRRPQRASQPECADRVPSESMTGDSRGEHHESSCAFHDESGRSGCSWGDAGAGSDAWRCPLAAQRRHCSVLEGGTRAAASWRVPGSPTPRMRTLSMLPIVSGSMICNS